jgi:molybdenum cofactor cytidylyltransferase
MSLARAMRLLPPSALTGTPANHGQGAVAVVGSGGKTTAIFQLARELLSADRHPLSAIVSATSHLGVWQIPLADRHIIAQTLADLDFDPVPGITLVTGPLEGERTQPLDLGLATRLNKLCLANRWPLLLEADGSRGHPLKAPAEHEPPIPEFVDTVLVVAGLSGIHRPLTDEFVHRPEIFSALSGLRMGGTITPEALARVLTHPQGGLKNIPPSARRVALLNQADSPELQAVGGRLAKSLLAEFDSVIVGSLHQTVFQTFEPIAGVILAAGGSTRYGEPKQLLDWRGEPFVRVAARTALSAGLDPVLVITGARAVEVEAALHDLPVVIVRNEAWQEGQASSIRAGVNALAPSQPPKNSTPGSLLARKISLSNFGEAPKAEGVGGCIFLLVDQPQVNVPILQALVERHSLDLPPALAPMVQDARANPVLFDRITFPDLLELKGDVGGRGLFHKFSPVYLPWHDNRLLLDVDTPEQYRRLVNDETL